MTAILAQHLPSLFGPGRRPAWRRTVARRLLALACIALALSTVLGEIGPGPSYADPREDADPVGFDNDFTRRNATIMSWNLMHLAGMLRSAGGLPTYGNDRNALADGERFGYAAPGPVADAG